MPEASVDNKTWPSRSRRSIYQIGTTYPRGVQAFFDHKYEVAAQGTDARLTLSTYELWQSVALYVTLAGESSFFTEYAIDSWHELQRLVWIGTGTYRKAPAPIRAHLDLSEDSRTMASTIEVYDGSDDSYREVTVIATSAPVTTFRCETDERHYPDADSFERHYQIRMPDGMEWTATAHWTGEANERNAFISLDEYWTSFAPMDQS